MKKNKFISKIKNYKPPKCITLLIAILPVLFVLIKKDAIDNDAWFLLNHGRYIFNNGFPTIEPFSMHQGFSFVMQQWLSASIFWFFYKLLGEFGLRLVVFIISFLITYFIYKISMLLSNKKFYVSCFISFIIVLLMIPFLTTRPQIFTYLIILIEVYILELYFKNDNKRYLYFLPILSLLEINLHSSMWFMLFVFMIPFILDSFKINIRFLKREGHKKIPLFCALIIMVLVGLINPYGVKAITYIFSSYGIPEVNSFVLEMKPLTIVGLIGKLYFATMFLILFFYIFYNSEKKYKLRYFLFYCGTLYLALSSAKCVPYFLIMGIIPISYYIKDDTYKSSINYSKRFEILCEVLCFIIVISCFVIAYVLKPNIESLEMKNATDYILKNYDKNKVKVYTDYNDGAFVEFKGFKCYIDPRAEVYFKSNNKKEDIFKEFYDLSNNNVECDVFLEKYKFDLLLLNEKSVLKKCASNKYKEVYNDKYRSVFERIH